MSKNFYIMQRGWMDNDAFSDEPYTEREAFLYLVENAAWKDRNYRVGARVYKLKRGQLTASFRYLAEAWQWNKNKVDRFLEILRISDMIGTVNGTESGTGQTVITICNYSKYQDVSQESGTDVGQQTGRSWDNVGTTLGQPWDKTNQDNQDNQDNNNNTRDPQEIEYQYLDWIDTFPKRGNEKKSREEFSKAITENRIDLDELKTKTQKYADAVAGHQPRFIKAPENWLKDECWNDPLPEPQEKEFDLDAYWKEDERKAQNAD